MTLPAWVPATEDKPAPMPLLLVQAFVNTLEAIPPFSQPVTFIREDGALDRLGRDEDALAWLTESGLLAAPAVAGGDLDLAREARESFRALIGGEPLTKEERRPLDTALAQSQPPLAIAADGHVRLGADPAETVADALVNLLLIIRDAQVDGSWDRLKLCANPDCRWAFYDRSHSRRGQWCDMTACGNRIKNRNLRARQAATPRSFDTSGGHSTP